MTDHWLLGGALAVIVESSHWLKFRWDFNEAATDRAWKLTLVLLVVAAVMIVLDGNPYYALPTLLSWLPPLLLPMMFVQAFGLASSIPLNTFSLAAKHRRKRNLRLGLKESVIHFHFGNFYLVAALVGATLGRPSSGDYRMYFLPGLIVLTGWMLLSASKTKPLPLMICLALAGGLSLAGQKGLERLGEMLGNRGGGRSGFNPNIDDTLIGRPVKVEQSPDIVWRVRVPDKTRLPRLLRTATYNSYSGGKWRVQPWLPEKNQFKTLDTIEPQSGVVFDIAAPNLSAAAQLEATAVRLPAFELRGAAFSETPLPLPGDVASLTGFERDLTERNALGTIRIFPKNSVIQGTVRWAGATDPESPPDPQYDLRKSSRREKEELQKIVDQLDLASGDSLPAKLERLRGWFSSDFIYTRDLKIDENFGSDSAITKFLTEEKSGHCEYFATATVLILRQAGIPARYAKGYAVVERDPSRDEFVIRGTHGHAWVRVWDAAAGKWFDFDTTPAVWPTTVQPQVTRMQRFSDAFQRLREDFFLWRNRPANRLAATLVMSAIALGVVGFILRRLWKSKRRLEAELRADGFTGPVVLTPLNALERKAEKRLGVRPIGQPLGEWLMTLRPALADARPLEEAVELHRKLRFDPAPAAPEDLNRLTELAKQVEKSVLRR